MILKPWHLAVAALSSWINDQQQQIIEFQNVRDSRNELTGKFVDGGEKVVPRYSIDVSVAKL